MKKKMVAIGVGIFIITALSAGAAGYLAQQSVQNKTAQGPASQQLKEKPQSNGDMPWRTSTTTTQAKQPQPQPQQPVNCNDNNIVGMAAGAIAGGLVGNQLGKGKGKTAATIGGTVGGAYLGQQYIPASGVACP